MKNKKELIKGIILILVGIIGHISTNSNPVPLIERIFKPIQRGNGTYYYAGIILLIIYYLGFNKIINSFWKKLKTQGEKMLLLIVVMVSMSLINKSYIYVERTYKTFQDDISAIYVHKEDSSINYNRIDNGVIKGEGILVLENMGNEDIQTYIKIVIPNNLKYRLVEDDIILKNEVGDLKSFAIPKKSKERIYLSFYVHLNDGENFEYAQSNNFEFVLFDDDKEIEFKKRYEL